MAFITSSIKSFSLKILVNAGGMTLFKFIGDCANLLFFLFLSRNYGPSGIGQYAYGMAIAGLAFSFTNLQLDEFTIRELSRLQRSERPRFLGKILSTQIIILLIVFIKI